MRDCDIKAMTPSQLFKQFTNLGDGPEGERLKDAIEERCLEQTAVPEIDHVPGVGWVFHGIIGGGKSRRFKRKARRLVYRRATPLECDVEDAMEKFYQEMGLKVRRQVKCRAGRIDLVVGRYETLVEVKAKLDRDALYEAIGQLMLYREATNQAARLVTAGLLTEEAIKLAGLVRSADVHMVGWDGKKFFCLDEILDEAEKND